MKIFIFGCELFCAPGIQKAFNSLQVNKLSSHSHANPLVIILQSIIYLLPFFSTSISFKLFPILDLRKLTAFCSLFLS